MKSPNFFIVGAPKCGTTALSVYLSEHPNVFFCDPKEPHYFAEDFDKHRPIRDFNSYLKLFRRAAPEHLAVGEGSVFYLYSKVALSNIRKLSPGAKIIVMLRNPIDLVCSLHQQYLHGLYEDEVDLHNAWDLQDARKNGKSIPRLCRQPELLLYGELGKLGIQVKRLFSIFPRNQIKIILFDDFVKDTAMVYRDVLNFIALPDDGRTLFFNINEARGFRSQIVSSMVRGVPISARNLITKLRFSKYLNLIPHAADKLFKAPQKRNPIESQFHHQLSEYFREDIALLETLIDKDLSKWIAHGDPLNAVSKTGA